MSNSLIAGLIAIGAFPYLWSLSFNPSLQLYVRTEGMRPLDPAKVTFAQVPNLLTPGPIFWVLAIFLLLSLGEGYCRAGGDHDFPALLVSTTSAILIGKAIIGPATRTVTTHKMSQDLVPSRPFSLRAADWLRNYVRDYVLVLINKGTLIAVFLGLFWLISELTGWFKNPTARISIPLLAAWFLIYQGRVSEYYQNVRSYQKKADYFRANTSADMQSALGGNPAAEMWEKVVNARLPIEFQFPLLILSFFPMLFAIYELLNNCGWQASGVPAVRSILTAAFGPLVLDVAGGLSGALIQSR